MTSEEAAVLKASENFPSLLTHPGFVEFVRIGKAAVTDAYISLAAVGADDFKKAQGWIDGANFILEIVDAAVRTSEALREQQRIADAAATDAALSRAKEFGRKRAERGSGMGASI